MGRFMPETLRRPDLSEVMMAKYERYKAMRFADQLQRLLDEL